MPTNRDATELDYNAPSRHIEVKLDIFFDATPLTITKDNYLVDFDLLEETFADTDKPFGAVSANEISFSLYNDTGIFSPINASSPYYNKIKKGVKVAAYIRPIVFGVTINWQPLGTFYVSEWSTQVTGSTVDATATDKLQAIFEKPALKPKVMRSMPFKDVFAAYFNDVGETAIIDQSLTEELLYAYATGDNKKYLNDLAIGAQAYVFCDRSGVPVVVYSRGTRQTAHTITDADQVLAISAEQSINMTYTGAEVVAHYPQESPIESLLVVDDLEVAPGEYISDTIAAASSPVLKVVAICLTGSPLVSVVGIEATGTDLKYTLYNRSEDAAHVRVEVLGTAVVANEAIISDDADSMLSVDNVYIQTAPYARAFKEVLGAYANNPVPMLTVNVRGNAFYKLGEKIHVVSTKYAVDFYGVLIRQTMSFNGGLSSVLTFINANILEAH